MCFQSANAPDGSINVAITDAQRAPVTNSRRYEVKHPQYANRQERLRTFTNARGQIPHGQNVDVLVLAGFFFFGKYHFETALTLADKAASCIEIGERLIYSFVCCQWSEVADFYHEDIFLFEEIDLFYTGILCF
jgi:hypothetical protein